MTKKWNLQDIHPTDRKPRKRSAGTRTQGGDMRRAPQSAESGRKKSRRSFAAASRSTHGGNRGRYIKIGAAALVIVLVGFFISMLFGGADLTVYPKNRDVTVQATFTASKEPGVGELGYELLTLEAEGQRQVRATGQEETSEQTEGEIVVYNAHSQNTQRLIKNTRFESPDGLIFRIFESVEVPGYTTGDDGEIVPGSVSARVFADEAGETYNIGPSRFTIPGLEGTDQFDGMYAESEVAFTGGFEGQRFIIDDAELESARFSLHDELRTALLTRFASERPAGFVAYENAIAITFELLPATEEGNNLATIKERGILRVPLFEDGGFASYIAENTIAGYEGEPVTLADAETLSFAYQSATTSGQDLDALDSLSFALSGDTQVVWTFDEEALKGDLAGLSRTALPNVLSGYPAIERAEAVIRPFWKQSFPESSDDIDLSIIVENDG